MDDSRKTISAIERPGRVIRNLFLASLAAVSLAACGQSAPSRSPCPAGKVCLQYGNASEPLTLDPQLSTGTWEDRIQSDLLIGLSQSDPQGKPIPGMAERWEISPDGLVWTFHLRDAVWSDAAPVTADDFVFSFRRLLDPKTGSEYASVFFLVKGAQAVNEGAARPETLAVHAIDARTLRIELNHPAPYLIELAKHHTMYPLPRHVVERWGKDWIKPEHFVGNGPYVLREYRLGNYVRSVKNPRFWDADKVCIDEVYYYPTNDSISAERRVARGELDLNTDIQSNRIAFLRGKMPGYVRTSTWLGVVYIAFNNNPRSGYAPFRDRRVRQALAMSIDREFIAGKLLRGGQLPATTLVPPGVANYAGAELPHWAAWPLARRQAQARRLLAEAGYGPDRPLKLEITHRNTPDPMLFMPAVQADWKEIGVQVTLAQEETQVAYADYRARAFQAADASWIADYNDPASFLDLQRSFYGPQNYGDYNSPAFDRLMALADQEPDVAKRAALMARAEHLMLEDAPVAPVYFLVNKNLVSPKITGWVDNLLDHHRTRWLCMKP